MKTVSRVCLIVCLNLLAACAITPEIGQSQDAVRSLRGEPPLAIPLPQAQREAGSQGTRWFYPGGPYGAPSYAVDFNRDGRVSDVRIALDDHITQTIAIGDSSEQLLARIGPPLRKIRFSNLHQTAWDYRYMDLWGYLVEFSVMIDDSNLVAGKASRRLNADRDDK
jgi:hypothetical protein